MRRGRALPTQLHLRAGEPPWPLVVFAHGWIGHPRKYTRLFGRWADAGNAVVARHHEYVENEPASDADGVVGDVTTASLDRVLHGSGTARPAVDRALGRLESEGLW